MEKQKKKPWIWDFGDELKTKTLNLSEKCVWQNHAGDCQIHTIRIFFLLPNNRGLKYICSLIMAGLLGK